MMSDESDRRINLVGSCIAVKHGYREGESQGRREMVTLGSLTWNSDIRHTFNVGTRLGCEGFLCKIKWEWLMISRWEIGAF